MSSPSPNPGPPPFDNAALTEQLRSFVIQQLAAGKTCPEIEDDLIRQGHPSDHVIEFVALIYRTGRGGREVYGTTVEYNDGMMVEFYEDPESVRSRRAAQRQRREIARAREGDNPAVDPALQEVQTTFSAELLRQRGDHSRVVLWGIAGVVLFTVAVSGALYLLVR